jgi:hypothetical protein
MRRFIHFISISILLVSCEDVIDLDLDTAEKELVIDARIDWQKGESIAYPVVDLSYTTSYFGKENSPAIADATITLKTASTTHTLTLWDGTSTLTSEIGTLKGGSRYVLASGITPKIGETYELSIKVNNKEYHAKAKMLEAPVIDPKRIVQKENSGLAGDQIELKVYFDGIDDKVANAYLVHLENPQDTKQNRYGTLDNNYIANNKFYFTTFAVFSDLKAGDKVDFTLYRISPEYKEYIDFVLRDIRGGGSFTIPARFHGNIINTANPKDNPLGAFRVSQYSKLTYTIK